jgi:hypothetical protein
LAAGFPESIGPPCNSIPVTKFHCLVEFGIQDSGPRDALVKINPPEICHRQCSE